MKKTIFHILIIALVIVYVSSCNEIRTEPYLALEQEDYTGTELKTNGYYYCENYYPFDEGYSNIYLFYSNGISINTYGTTDTIEQYDITLEVFKEIVPIEEEFRNGDWFKDMGDDRRTYGLFKIDNSNIKIEHWIRQESFHTEKDPSNCTSAGTILNDTTFIITESYHENKRGKTSEYFVRDWTYHFKKFSPKPDSTNTFIE